MTVYLLARGFAVDDAKPTNVLNFVCARTAIDGMFAFVMLAVGAMILRRTKLGQDRPFRCFAGWVARPLAIASIAFLMFSLLPATWIRFVVCAAICVVVYS